MANSTRTPGVGEDIRTEDKGGVKTQVVLLDVGGSGEEALAGDAGFGLPVVGASRAASGTLEAGGDAVLSATHGMDGVLFSLTGTYAPDGAGVLIERTYDGGSTWVEAQFVDVFANVTTGFVTLSENGALDLVASVRGADQVRVLLDNTLASGVIDVRASATTAPMIGATTIAGDVAVYLPEGLPSSRIEDTPHTTGDVGMFMLGVRRDTVDDATDTDGDYSAVAVDRVGRIIVSSFTPMITTPYLGGNSGTINDVDQTVFAAGVDDIVFEVTGSWAGELIAEVQLGGDGSWVPLAPGLLLDLSTGVAPASPITANGMYAVNFSGRLNFQMRSTAWTSGEATVLVSAVGSFD